MKDFASWSQEYLLEAEALRRRVAVLRSELAAAPCSQCSDLNRRIAILYTMYLECRHTGQLLREHPAALREQQLGGSAHGSQASQL